MSIITRFPFRRPRQDGPSTRGLVTVELTSPRICVSFIESDKGDRPPVRTIGLTVEQDGVSVSFPVGSKRDVAELLAELTAGGAWLLEKAA